MVHVLVFFFLLFRLRSLQNTYDVSDGQYRSEGTPPSQIRILFWTDTNRSV